MRRIAPASFSHTEFRQSTVWIETIPSLPPTVVGMKNGGSKKERVFLSRNIVRYKGEDTLVLYSQKDFHCPRRRRRWDFLIARRSLAYSKAFLARIFRYLMARSVRRICENSIEHNRESTLTRTANKANSGIPNFSKSTVSRDKDIVPL